MTGKRVLSVSLPEDVYAALSLEVENRKRQGVACSMGALVLEALRRPVVAHNPVAVRLTEEIPGLMLGIPEPPLVDGLLDAEPDWEAMAVEEFGRNILARCQRELRGYAKADWKRRLEMLRELREQQAGS